MHNFFVDMAMLAIFLVGAGLAKPVQRHDDVQPTTVTIDVVKDFGNVSQASITAALAEARRAFAASENSQVTVFFQEGTYTINEHGDYPFLVSGLAPEGSNGSLIIAGAGKYKTSLIFEGTNDTFHGSPINRLTIRDMHLGRTGTTVTQGVVVEANSTQVTIEVPTGFPSPQDLFNNESGQGRFLRRYTNSSNDNHLVVDPANQGLVWPPTMNLQVPWTHSEPVDGNIANTGVGQWRLFIKPHRRNTSIYQHGDFVCVKSKHNGQAFFFDHGDSLRFENVLWTGHSRGVARGGISNIDVLNCSVERQAPVQGITPCLATNGGGPQLGQPDDPVIYNVTVTNFSAVATGDDSVALFNVASGSATGCVIRDSYCRGILLFNSPNVHLENNRLTRNPVWNTSHL